MFYKYTITNEGSQGWWSPLMHNLIGLTFYSSLDDEERKFGGWSWAEGNIVKETDLAKEVFYKGEKVLHIKTVGSWELKVETENSVYGIQRERLFEEHKHFIEYPIDIEGYFI